MSTLFLDSNVLLEGLLLEWGVSKAVLSLCAAGIHRLLLAEVVIEEVETNLLLEAERRGQVRGGKLLSAYDKFLKIAKPQRIKKPSNREVLAVAPLIRHVHDVPVLASALKANPRWLLSNNTRHFDRQVAARTGLQIATPLQFFKIIHANA